jgi:hypothetical protein
MGRKINVDGHFTINRRHESDATRSFPNPVTTPTQGMAIGEMHTYFAHHQTKRGEPWIARTIMSKPSLRYV